MKPRTLMVLNMICLCLLVILIAAPQPGAPAQQLVADGTALDNNLRLGSGGYNRRVAPNRFQQSRYTFGSSRYRYGGRTGEYLPSNDRRFAQRGRYRSTGYQGNRTTYAHSRRYRYQGSGYRRR